MPSEPASPRPRRNSVTTTTTDEAMPSPAPPATPATVHQAIAAVMADLPGIGKDDRSPEGYQYRGIEAVTRHLQPLMARHGVVVVPQAAVQQVVPSPAMKDGWQDVHLTVTWQVYGPDGSSVTATTVGIGRDRADKGTNKAHTQALKYLLLSLFMVADKADDAEAHDVTPEGDRARPPAPPPPPARPELVALGDALTAAGITDRAERLEMVQRAAGRPITRASDLTPDEAAQVLARLTAPLSPADTDTDQPVPA